MAYISIIIYGSDIIYKGSHSKYLFLIGVFGSTQQCCNGERPCQVFVRPGFKFVPTERCLSSFRKGMKINPTNHI